jgi:hypothetical protein
MARKEKKYHFIYKTTNILSGRYYIGMHSTDSLDDGYLGSGNRLRLAIRKHGKSNFKREILEFCETRADLKKREKEIVTLDEIAKDECMNLVVGGEGGFISEDGVKLGRVKCDEKLKEKYGEKFKIVIIKNYHSNLTEEEKLIRGKNISNGQKHSGFDFGSPFRGKNHSDQTKKKMSESSKGKGIGESNSQYGTCWITKDGSNKKIKKEELDTYLNEGWVKGRK